LLWLSLPARRAKRTGRIGRYNSPVEPAQIEQFITDGFVRIDHAFPREHAEAARGILWKATGCDPDNPATWTQPVIRLGMFTQSPFIEAANTPRLHAAFDQLVGRSEEHTS